MGLFYSPCEITPRARALKMGLLGLRDHPFVLSRTQAQLRNGAIALVVQFVSLVLTIVGISNIRSAVEDANVDSSRSGDFIPWLTAIVVMFCLLVVGADALALYVILKDMAAGSCQQSFKWMLHIFMWFSTVFIALCSVSLAIGYVIKGLGNSGLLNYNYAEGDLIVFYGLTANELRSLYSAIGQYLGGAWMVTIGAFLSIPSQAWMLTAMSVQVSFSEARQTMYNPGRRASKPISSSDGTPRVPLLGEGPGSGML